MGEINGIIRSYAITYFPTSNASALPIEDTVLGNETSFTASDLEPFTNYTFEVVAVTISPGPPDSIVIQTEEAGEIYFFKCTYIVCVCINTGVYLHRGQQGPPPPKKGIIKNHDIFITYTDKTLVMITVLHTSTTYTCICSAHPPPPHVLHLPLGPPTCPPISILPCSPTPHPPHFFPDKSLTYIIDSIVRHEGSGQSLKYNLLLFSLYILF